MLNYISDFVSNYESDFETDLVSNYVSDIVSNFVSNYISDFVSNYLSEFVSNYGPDFVSNYVSDNKTYIHMIHNLIQILYQIMCQITKLTSNMDVLKTFFHILFIHLTRCLSHLEN